MGDGDPLERGRLHSMVESTREDWEWIYEAMKPFIGALPDLVLAHLELLEGDSGGFAIDRLQHCLQTATRAHRDGRDDEHVRMRAAHDSDDTLGPRKTMSMSPPRSSKTRYR